MDHTVAQSIRLNEKACVLPSAPEFATLVSGVRLHAEGLNIAIYNSVALFYLRSVFSLAHCA
jgi:hypothetical protein